MQTCRNYGVKAKLASTYNPQSNRIIQQKHLVISNTLRTFENDNSDLSPMMASRAFISASSWAIHSTYHTTLQATPEQLVFGRDMLLLIPFRADWAQIKLRKQGLINKGVLRESASRIQHEYKVGDHVLLDKPSLSCVNLLSQERDHILFQKYIRIFSTVQIERGAITERVAL
jgi:hypothetical protein